MSRRRDPIFLYERVRDSWTVRASMHVQSQRRAPRGRQAKKAAADESHERHKSHRLPARQIEA
ncbi:hypothetical protein CU048_03815 [Beijerinckiaceae bacterium]|nr:hypothetical protein CU048_03815 [Beijerinckiaceae bacterium]